MNRAKITAIICVIVPRMLNTNPVILMALFPLLMLTADKIIPMSRVAVCKEPI